MSTIGIFILWKDYKNPREDIFHLNQGGSVVWFFILYITGTFIGKYNTNYKGLIKYIYCFFVYNYIFNCFLHIFQINEK